MTSLVGVQFCTGEDDKDDESYSFVLPNPQPEDCATAYCTGN